jgi:hypothetical protein
MRTGIEEVAAREIVSPQDDLAHALLTKELFSSDLSVLLPGDSSPIDDW